MAEKEQIPNASWPVEKLVNHASKRLTRMAQDCWHIGKCLSLCQEKVGRGGWMKWLQEHLPQVSYSMTHRYMGLAKRIEHPDELEGMKICEALLAAGIITDGGKSKVKGREAPGAVLPKFLPAAEVPDARGKATAPVISPELPARLRMPDGPPLSLHVRAIISANEREHDLTRAEIGKAIKVLQILLGQSKKRKAG